VEEVNALEKAGKTAIEKRIQLQIQIVDVQAIGKLRESEGKRSPIVEEIRKDAIMGIIADQMDTTVLETPYSFHLDLRTQQKAIAALECGAPVLGCLRTHGLDSEERFLAQSKSNEEQALAQSNQTPSVGILGEGQGQQATTTVPDRETRLRGTAPSHPRVFYHPRPSLPTQQIFESQMITQLTNDESLLSSRPNNVLNSNETSTYQLKRNITEMIQSDGNCTEHFKRTPLKMVERAPAHIFLAPFDEESKHYLKFIASL